MDAAVNQKKPMADASIDADMPSRMLSVHEGGYAHFARGDC